MSLQYSNDPLLHVKTLRDLPVTDLEPLDADDVPGDGADHAELLAVYHLAIRDAGVVHS